MKYWLVGPLGEGRGIKINFLLKMVTGFWSGNPLNNQINLQKEKKSK